MGLITCLAVWGISTASIFGMLEIIVLICTFITGRWDNFFIITGFVFGAALGMGGLSVFIYLTEKEKL